MAASANGVNPLMAFSKERSTMVLPRSIPLMRCCSAP